MLATWILPTAILMACAVLLLAPLFEVLGTSCRTVALWCPFKNRKFTASFIERGTLGISKKEDVSACTAFEDAHAVTCEKRCRELPDNWLEELSMERGDVQEGEA